jgi:hypothetical protein
MAGEAMARMATNAIADGKQGEEFVVMCKALARRDRTFRLAGKMAFSGALEAVRRSRNGEHKKGPRRGLFRCVGPDQAE